MKLAVLRSNSVQLRLLDQWISKYLGGCVAWWAHQERIPGFQQTVGGNEEDN